MKVILFEAVSQVIVDVFQFSWHLMPFGHVQIQDMLFFLCLSQFSPQLLSYCFCGIQTVSTLLSRLIRRFHRISAKLSQPLLKSEQSVSHQGLLLAGCLRNITKPSVVCLEVVVPACHCSFQTLHLVLEGIMCGSLPGHSQLVLCLLPYSRCTTAARCVLVSCISRRSSRSCFYRETLSASIRASSLAFSFTMRVSLSTVANSASILHTKRGTFEQAEPSLFLHVSDSCWTERSHPFTCPRTSYYYCWAAAQPVAVRECVHIQILIMEWESQSKEEVPSFTALSLKEEPDIARNLFGLISAEVALQLSNIHPDISERLRCSWEEALVQLRVELRRGELRRAVGDGEGAVLSEGRVREVLGRVAKLKEVSLYFGQLRKQSGSLQRDVQKFLFYEARSQGLEEKLQRFFSEPIVSELFLKEYERSFNLNNFTADLIAFFRFLHQHCLLEAPPPSPCLPQRNRDLQLIQNSNIIFRQICDINDKYAHVEQQLHYSYVHLRLTVPSPSPSGLNDPRRSKFSSEEAVIDQKYLHLQAIFHKIKAIYGGVQFNAHDAHPLTLLLPEEPALFNRLDSAFTHHAPSRNEHFLAFLEGLYDPAIAQGLQEAGRAAHFDFLRQKIIRAETRWHLNRVLSAFNVGSHVMAQLDSSLQLTHHVYSFSTPFLLAQHEFNASRTPFYSSRMATAEQLGILGKGALVGRREQGFVVRIQRHAVLYPSAVNNYLCFLQFLYLLSCELQPLGLYGEEAMLQLLEVRADELMQWAETALNLHDLIKQRYFRSYAPLQQYLSLLFRMPHRQELDFLRRTLPSGSQGAAKLLGHFADRQRKAGCISQIIFQLQGGYDIGEALAQLVGLQAEMQGGLHSADCASFYERVLNEIIQTKNNLKFDRCLSFNALHQTFGFLAARPDSLNELAQQLGPLSRDWLRLPELLRFYAAQTKVKRQVFKAELYWITVAQPSVKSKFIINSQRKKPSFRDFLDENAKNILALSDRPLAHFLTGLEEFQRSVLLFAQEVDRLKLIQCALLYLKPDFPLEDHLSAFSHRQLTAFFAQVSQFNPVEDLFVRREKKQWVLGNIRRLIGNGGKLKFADLALDPVLLTLKQQLANYIFFLGAFEHHYTFEDCSALLGRVVRGGEPPEYALKLEILRSKRDTLKEYEQAQFMEAPALADLTHIHQLLLLLGITRLLRNPQLPPADIPLLESLRTQLPSYEPFLALEGLHELEEVKEAACINSRAHTLCALRTLITFYREARDRSRKQEWMALGVVSRLAEMGVVARRLFCNQLAELRRAVAADQWRSFSKPVCLSNLREELDRQFTARLNSFFQAWLPHQPLLPPTSSPSQAFSSLDERFRTQVVAQYDLKYSLPAVRRHPIVLFDEFRGYQVQVELDEQGGESPRAGGRRGRGQRTVKRGLLNGARRQDQGSTQVINELQHRINIQIVRESLPMRKLIYQLQLEGKRIRDQISWETCKLQHNVISKINKFIEESTLDQKQSLINFKYTVNLQTIKGIENVISQRAAIFLKNSQDQPDITEAPAFLTQPHPNKPQQKKENEGEQSSQSKKEMMGEEESLLEVNVRNIFSHVKKLKVFWAWKNLHMQRLSSEDEWVKFSQNVQRILHNADNLRRTHHLQQLREDCNRHQIVCNLIKEENVLLNNAIKKMKVESLTKKLNAFKDKHHLEQP